MSDRRKSEIRFAVIGCGLMGQRHAAVIRATPGARLVALQDRHREVAEKTAHPGELATDNYAELLSSPDVDAVVICLPSGLHAAFGIEAARAGKHVVVEKPLAIDPAQARNLAAECAAAGVVCAEIKQNRFADGIQALKAAVIRGDLGKIVLVRASVKWFRHDPYYTASDWRGRVAGEGGGVLINQAIHSTDLLLWLFGRPLAVTAMTESNRAGVMETEDTAVALLRFRGGILGVLEATTSAYPGFDERYEIQGLKASCVLAKGQIVFWKHEDDLPCPASPEAGLSRDGDVLDPRLTLFQRQYRNIMAAIRGEEELVVTPEEAIAAVELTREIYEAAGRTGSVPR